MLTAESETIFLQVRHSIAKNGSTTQMISPVTVERVEMILLAKPTWLFPWLLCSMTPNVTELQGLDRIIYGDHCMRSIACRS